MEAYLVAATLLAFVLALFGHGIWRDLRQARWEARCTAASAHVGRLMVASGRYDADPYFRDGIRAFVTEAHGHVTMALSNQGRHRAEDPGAALSDAIACVGDLHRHPKGERHYDFMIRGVPESATLRAAARTGRAAAIRQVGIEIGGGRIPPAIELLALQAEA